MAQIKHNNFLDTVDQVFAQAKDMKILHLKAEGLYFDGRFIQVEGKKLYHFGTTGYLGLEQDKRLKMAACDAINKYGTQFPLSKSYIAHPLYEKLENLLNRLYGQEVIVAKNATLAHMAALPVLVGDNDTIILDHQVHWSVQDAAKRLKLRGVKIELVRHNRMDQLEEKIQKMGSKSDKIWYMADGVYSMHGDYAPIDRLRELTEKYKQLHLYFDDVHGMSWCGKNGRGYVFDKIQGIIKKCVIIGTLSKTFGANGSLIICGDAEYHRQIKNFGGPLTFSAQLDPASVGAAIASSKIHLSAEIGEMQMQLQEKIQYFNELLTKLELPIVEKNDSPVFFLATGIPETGYQLTSHLLKEGFYVNMGLFPAVPSKNTGLRITLSRHNEKEEIRELAHALKELYPKVMHITGNNFEKLSLSFKKDFTQIGNVASTVETLDVVMYKTITDFKPEFWDNHFAGQGILDWNGWNFIEKVFSHGELPENQWRFFYFSITDSKGELVLLGAFSLCLWKEDLLAPVEVSKKIERQRLLNPYDLTSNVLSLGSLFSDGMPLYVDKDHAEHEKALDILINKLDILGDRHEAPKLIFRDFLYSKDWDRTFNKKGFIPMDMPETALVENLSWDGEKEFLKGLSTRSRKHFKKDIQPYQDKVRVRIRSTVEKKELNRFYELYKNVKERNLGLNTFPYPFELFEEMNVSPQWEFIYLETPDDIGTEILGVMFCYKNSERTYVPSLIGMDYEHNREYQTYRQLLYESIKRANHLGFLTVDFGISANFEKRKLGAKLHKRRAYVRSENNFIAEVLESQRNK
ncbi:MAG TPA: GNAT family N-acetyltransferase [Leeuwenhoekiella sp.]|nr:GNAT family N-acetyltransferase [Leeuwenhoekiella sp.]